MSKSVNTKFGKCFIIFMAVVILAQGVVYLGLAIQGIKMHNCSGENSDPVGKTFEFILNLIYFSSQDCGEPILHVPESITIPDIPNGPQISRDFKLEIDFKKANILSDREYIFLIGYAVISALWVITSFLVLVTICCTLTKLVALVCFWPWLISVLLGSILDAVATGFHIKDILQTKSAKSTFEYVGVINIDEVLDYFKDYLKDYDIFFMIPAVVFACITSRIVLIWLLNIFGSIFCMSLAKIMSSNNDEENSKQSRRPSSADTAVPFDSNNEMEEQTVEVRFRPSPETVRKVRSTLEPVQKSPVQTPTTEKPIEPYALPVLRPTSSNKNSRVSVPKSPPINPAEASTYQISDAHPENLDYPPNRLSTPSSHKRSVTPELSAISPLNLRYSTVDGASLFPNQPHVSQELRGQLPWSYTNIMNDPIAQKKIHSHLTPPADDDSDKDFPPIPVPDYTLHPPKKDRTPVVGQDRLSQTGYSRW
ncbi:uncharacterized protein LOC129911761 [Episyrphus balteatus]|uniref:uncharacterized protein LOC129911761 n=1 Tax=Episyrphus balteatus TaxID=286459 RepID=UPI002486A03A|nr:uncharacterized protein LOC129911761 [Episyrphus balteatus]XP_055845648.1 uncharacterized protein LOC129911761 [Episyrphus balteatus]XP_055845649.1 uncharacterized protein LOC129911761 [Episyrphus balteatus]